MFYCGYNMEEEKPKTLKVLNLYAGIGGNRKLWENVEVTAIENNPEIAEVYKKLFPHITSYLDSEQYLALLENDCT